jgi:addiction module RelE/StbE family toxin
MQLLYTPQALTDLAAIHHYIAADNPTRAQSYVQHLMHQANGLLLFPQRGPTMPGMPMWCRYVVVDDYIITYEVEEDKTLTIVRVVHAKRDILTSTLT